MDLKFYQILELIQNKLSNIERSVVRLEEKLDLSLSIQRNHLIRIKNKEILSDDMILYGRPYNDLSPQDAYKTYQNKDLDFIFIDVSQKNFNPPSEIENVIKIPLEELPQQYGNLINKTTPILIISEDGVRSILACELLVKKGHFNVNNISGGHKFWPGHRTSSSVGHLDRQGKGVASEGLDS